MVREQMCLLLSNGWEFGETLEIRVLPTTVSNPILIWALQETKNWSSFLKISTFFLHFLSLFPFALCSAVDHDYKSLTKLLSLILVWPLTVSLRATAAAVRALLPLLSVFHRRRRNTVSIGMSELPSTRPRRRSCLRPSLILTLLQCTQPLLS